MASVRVNVLVYNGPGATGESLRHAFSTLRRLLTPAYAVAPLSDTALLREPWASTCALLVMPGGADLGYCRLLNGAGTSRIREYVRQGGSYLGLCAGAYFGSARCEFEVGSSQPDMEVVGPRELAFFPGICRGGAFSGFQYKSEAGARAAKMITDQGETVVYYNGGGVFVDAGSMKAQGIDVLATYHDDIDVDGGTDGGKAAVIHRKFGEGNVCLMGTHPEFVADNLNSHPEVPDYGKLIRTLAAGDESRNTFLTMCLERLGLTVNTKPAVLPALSRLHLSSIGRSEVVELLFSLQSHMTRENGVEILKGERDTFRFLLSTVTETEEASSPSADENEVKPLENFTDDNGETNYSAITKDVLYHDGAWPDRSMCPKFNHELFYNSIRAFQVEEEDMEDWGKIVLYGDVVTSTNSLLEKNPKLLSQLPTGFTFVASTQVAGRGRGSNIWVTPDGCLPFSVVINHPAHLSATRPIVFIQYIAAVAVAEAIQTYDAGNGQIAVKLKWPNDIYALDPNSPPAQYSSYVKVGGILSNCVYADGHYQIVLGIGLNVSNARPTTSLDALLPHSSDGAIMAPFSPFRPERLLARIITRFGKLYNEFRRTGFSGELEAAYYRHWLHNDQCVTIEVDGGSFFGRVMGITRDWGMLKVEELDEGGKGTGKSWALQSNENSFDYWKGLVRRKI